MGHRQVRLSKERAEWAQRFKVPAVKGTPLNPSGAIAVRYNDVLQAHIVAMEREVMRELRALYSDADAMDSAYAMDASIASQARIVMNRMSDKFTAVFAKFARPLAEKIIGQTSRDSGLKLGASLKEMSGNYTLDPSMLSEDLRNIISSSVTENVNLITRTKDKYLDEISGVVNRSIQTGNGLADIIPALDKCGVTVKNWSKNVALDQTRKAYNALNKGRMEALGLKKFQWVHSGGSAHPREYHRDVLNGKIFSFDDLPYLDGPEKGERGIPGQAIFCRCTMRPVFDFDDDED